MTKSDKKILITGAGGYIGSCLVDLALKNGYHVKALDTYYFGKDKLQSFFSNPHFELIEQDIRQIELSSFEDCYAVIDLAGISNDPSGELNARLTSSTNYEGAVKVAKKAKEAKVARYIYMSSCAIYGQATGICKETNDENPLTLYAKSKSLAEKEILKLSDDQFCVTSLRNSTTFGPSLRMRFDLVVNTMILSALQNNHIIIHGQGNQRRPLIHVHDVAEICLILLAESPKKINHEIYNIGFTNYKISEIAKDVQEILYQKQKNTIEIIHEGIQNDLRDYEVSFEKFRRHFSFFPKKTIKMGIEEIYDALETKKIIIDENCITLNFYKNLVEENEHSLLLT